MKVCIAEKPSVAREIAKIIGADKRYDGYLEGNGYQVTWTFGHFCSLYEPQKYYPHWKRWDLNSLPMLPSKFLTNVLEDKGIQKQYNCIKKLVNNATEVINCGDAGQEGELIQRWVLNQTGYKGEVKRLWISSLTNEAIKDGFKNLLPAENFDNLYYAGFSRAIGDWLLGINGTRLFTLMFAKEKQVLSIGRVQTPTLAMIVNRYLEIEKFVSKPYWEIQTVYRNTTFQSDKGKIDTKEKAQILLDTLKGKELTITSSVKKKGKEAPPRLFDLTSLQVECNKKFGFTADQTLKLIQSLYEKKVVTYPRVDTTYLPTDMYPKIGGILKKLSNYTEQTAPLKGKTIRKSSKVFNNKKITDHHAIIPTGENTHLQPLEFQVYDTITKRFISAFYPDCIFSQTTVIGEVEKVKFKTTGKEILEKGWREIYPSTKEDKNKESSFMPSFIKGEKGEQNPKVSEKQTNPPKHFTEASLLRAMETAGKNMDDDELRDALKENGIGRPSTRASIIETLFRRKYLKRSKKLILPTAMGIQLIGLIDNDLLKSAELTGQWEKQLREIETGEYKASVFIKNMKKMVDDIVLDVRMGGKTIKLSERMNKPNEKLKKNKKLMLIGRDCIKCSSGTIIKGKKSYGCSNWKKGCNFKIPFIFGDKKISENQWLRLLEKGETVKLKGFKINGESKDGKLCFNENKEILFSPSEIINKAPENIDNKDNSCPKCKKGKILKGKTAYGCSEWKSGCDFRRSF